MMYSKPELPPNIESQKFYIKVYLFGDFLNSKSKDTTETGVYC